MNKYHNHANKRAKKLISNFRKITQKNKVSKDFGQSLALRFKDTLLKEDNLPYKEIQTLYSLVSKEIRKITI